MSDEVTIRRADPMQLPDRSEVWVRARLRNNGGDPYVELIEQDGCDSRGAWLHYDDPREAFGVTYVVVNDEKAPPGSTGRGRSNHGGAVSGRRTSGR